MDLLEIGKIVNRKRAMLNLRQEDLSEMSMVSVKTIRQIEAGKGNPSYLTLSKLFDILGLVMNVRVKQVVISPKERC